ncbi:MAG TPA: class I SAM-dependent methyltransferase [Allosphingosinicella sp.]|nr:class I SAM-dependent methyltransferase [Allosphingosinicella sp.]
MRSEDVQSLYDADYAAAYDDAFLLGAANRASTGFELALIRETLAGGGRWLDLGCGTGYVLAQFPGVARAGLDLSGAMVDLARGRNPDALFVEQGNFLAARPEWAGRWDLVTCMWGAYCYLDSLAEVARLVRNMAGWTAPGGSVLIPCLSFPGNRIPYEHEPDPWGGRARVHGHIWSWDHGDKRHSNLILPHPGQIVSWLAPFFGRIRVVLYPTGRTAVLAQARHSADAPDEPPIIAWDAGTQPSDGPALEEASFGALLRALVARIARRRR